MGEADTGTGRGRTAARSRTGGDEGQVAVEFIGMLPVIIATLVLLWQCALLGYTYTLAGNAADKAAHAAAVADLRRESRGQACERAGKEDLEGDWRKSARTDCWVDSGLVKAEVGLKVPVLFPGIADFPFSVTGNAAAAKEN
ncbi:TadE/TadG family type IV pilus assembly protein [Streptomyces barkulensis]|uniref:TadE/TadG family type IV pilus assembly protein n=1 Tax=Streptomyces barkulensis TaxID=1257026 RepID=UPI000C6CA1EA|nr:TadE/TadG family type IV pilus assembly protein [Streptomyces barkulensis]